MVELMFVVLGMTLGIFVPCWAFFALRSGTLLLRRDQDDGTPYLFLNMEKDIDTILKKKYVLFIIDPEARRPRR